MNCIAYGEVLWDVYPDKSVIGGAPLNFAVHLSLLGENVFLITGIGHDKLGEKTLECIKSYGINTDYISVNNKSTGECRVTLDESGVPTYRIMTDSAYDNIKLDSETVAKLGQIKADLFYFNTLAQRSPVSRETLKMLLNVIDAKTVMCDLNIRQNCYDKDSVELCLSHADVVKLSSEEAHFLTDIGAVEGGENIFDNIHRQYPNISLLVYTMGGDGSMVYDYVNGKTYCSGKPENVKVVSTVGAGDCYGASFIKKYLDGCGIDEAISFAAHRSSIVVAHKEAIPECLSRNA
jgi:fructokinase